MGQKIIVIAPHPDDETLGCGGTILKHISQGDQAYWLIVTEAKEEDGFSRERIASRKVEIDEVTKRYGFKGTIQLNLPTTRLDQINDNEIISKMSQVFNEVKPEIIYLPYRGDIHSDHKVVFDAVAACTKWFRYGFIKKVLVYETLSETEFAINPDLNGFRPNVFVNIEPYMEKKLEIMNVFASEMGEFPFPRSEKAIRALSVVRGATAGFEAAEAFMLLKEVVE